MSHAESAPKGPRCGKGKLAPHQAFLKELVAQDPDITLFEMRDALAEAGGTGASLRHQRPAFPAWIASIRGIP